MYSNYDGGFPVSICTPAIPGIQSSIMTQTHFSSTMPPRNTAPHSMMGVLPPVHQNSEESRLVAHSPYDLNRTSPHPDQSSPRTCEWVTDDGTKCGAQITLKDIPGHLRATHGIKHLTRNHRILCKWSGCRRRGSTDMMNRECIVRHVREVHLYCKRSSHTHAVSSSSVS